MTLLSALADLYERLAARGDVAAPGYAPARISYELVLSDAGEPVELNDIRTRSGKTTRPRELLVPVSADTRTSAIKPMFLWDKTAYTLGVVNIAGKGETPRPGQGRRTAAEHAAFMSFHQDLLAGTDDPGLLAFLAFLDRWRPEMVADLEERGFTPEALDQNIVFRLETEKRHLHDRPAAQKVWSETNTGSEEVAACLVSGKTAPVARLHPMLRGVAGAQSSGAALVSFNWPAFNSYSQTIGRHLPVSAYSAFAYTTALNWLLSHRHVHIGDRTRAVEVQDETQLAGRRRLTVADTTVVFWAATSVGGEEAAEAAEGWIAQWVDPQTPEDDGDADRPEAGRIRAALETVAQARPVKEIDPRLDERTTMHLLGLAPNNARLSVRFWHVDSFGALARRLAMHWRDLEIEPAGWKRGPSVWSLVLETALQGKADNAPPRLGGEVMRAILTGDRYPRTLLSGVVQRVRADGRIDGRRAAICKAVVVRDCRLNNEEEDLPMSLDRDNPNPAYRLGRLFAMLEGAQTAALPGLNATIKDRYFAAACATPRRVFPLLNKNAMHHLGQLRKTGRGGLAHWLEAEIGEIWAGLQDDLPASCRLEEQGRFIAGYYHQRHARKRTEPEPETAADADLALDAAPDPEMED